MSMEFARLRRYNAARVVFRAVALGLATCLLPVGILLMLQKWNTLPVQAWYYAVAVGAGLAVGGLTFLLLRRKDLRLAEQLDREFGLKERVQTMVAFRNEDSAMLRIQREDTENRLHQITAFGAKKATMAMHAAALALGVVVFAVGLILPAKAVVAPTQTRPPYVVTNWQEDAMRELIAYTEKSGMSDSAKEKVVAQLDKLLKELLDGVAVEDMKPTVLGAVNQIYTVNDEANSFDSISEAVELLRDERKTIVQEIFGDVNNNNSAKLQADTEKLRAELAKEERLESLNGFGSDLGSILEGIGSFNEEDALYAAAVKLAKDMQQIGADYKETLDVGTAQDRLGVACNELCNAAGPALAQQKTNRQVTEHVVRELANIFDISEAELPQDPEEAAPEQNQETEPNPGGIGPGEMQYAGEDAVYDYKNNVNVKYGEVISEYYAAAYEKLTSGKVDEDVKKFIQDYFGILHDSEDTKN